MKRLVGIKPAEKVILTASEVACTICGGKLWICQHRQRWIQGIDRYLHVIRRDKTCKTEGCPGRRTIFRPPEDIRLALPRRTFGLDVTMHIGERHLRHGEALAKIGRDLNARDVPIDQTHVGWLFRDFMALAKLARGDNEAMRAELRAQGGIVLMADGVQFDERSPVLYLAWDARSGTPLFGERKSFRAADDLRPILERVKAMDVPVIGIVTDKERGLVPAVEAVFPDTPYQFCQTHFWKNCALPLRADRAKLQESVARRAEAVRKIAKRLHIQPQPQPDDSAAMGKTPPTSGDAPIDRANAIGSTGDAESRERGLAEAVCGLARQNSRVSGKPPLDPPELKRHQRLERLRGLVEKARKKGEPLLTAVLQPSPTRCSTRSRRR